MLRFSAVVILSVVSSAASAPPETRPADFGPPAPWTIDDLITAETASGWTISRDGALVAWVQSNVVTIDGEEKRASNLWMNRLDNTAESIQLTQGTDSVLAPQFSPDGKRIAFLTTRKMPAGGPKKAGGDEDSKPQIWVMAVDGGEARPVTRLDRGITAFRWRDNDTIIFAAPESPSLWEQEHKEHKDTAVIVEDAERQPPVRIYSVEVDHGEVKRLTRNTDWIDSLAVSPDGKWAAATAQQSLSYEFDEKVRPKLYLIDLAGSNDMTSLIDAKINLVPSSIAWSPDSSGFFFANAYSHHPQYRSASVLQLHRCDIATRQISRIDLDWERGLAFGLSAINTGFIALLADGTRSHPAMYRLTDGAYRRTDLAGEHARTIDSLVASPDGTRLMYVSSSETRIPQGWSARLHEGAIADARPLTKLNQGLAKKPTGRVDVIEWKGAKGDSVEGLLGYPLNYEAARKYPLVLIPHGGPAGTSTDTWASNWAEPFVLLRQKGAFTLEPNYHGSAGYGLDWVESIAGHYYELEIPDLQKGVDQLIAQGLVDPDRLGVAGWSNGGILTADIITKDNRFKAAIVGAGEVEWISDWANVDFGAGFDNYYFGGPPWEQLQHYIDKSPFFRLPNVTTPTLVHTGTEDRAVPPHESWSLFRALQQIGKAPVRLVTYPGEPHGLRKIAHQRRKLEEDMAWWDKYLFNEQPKTIEAVKDGSPLAGLIERDKAAMVDGRYGVRAADGTLAPEFVTFAGLQVSRFEITRAQFGEFDANTPRGDGGGGGARRPMMGVTFEQAKAYAEWLAQKLNQPVRLPTEDEMKRLAAIAGTGGNTLDRLAGYAPNHDDAARLRERIAHLADPASIILPVGSLSGAKDPSSEQSVFDLDGNLAEWAIKPDGSGVALGPCADCPAEPRDEAFGPGEMYRGIRVVIGTPPVARSSRPGE